MGVPSGVHSFRGEFMTFCCVHSFYLFRMFFMHLHFKFGMFVFCLDLHHARVPPLEIRRPETAYLPQCHRLDNVHCRNCCGRSRSFLSHWSYKTQLLIVHKKLQKVNAVVILFSCFLPQSDLFSGAVFVQQTLGWNIWGSAVFLLAIALVFTSLGRPTARGLFICNKKCSKIETRSPLLVLNGDCIRRFLKFTRYT